MWRSVKEIKSKHRISEAAKRTKQKQGKRDRPEHVIRYHLNPESTLYANTFTFNF